MVLGKLNEAAKDKPILFTIAGTAVALTATITAAATLGINLVPWPTHREFLELRHDVKEVKKLTIGNARAIWQREYSEAIEELAKHPDSRTAQRQKAEAEEQLRRLVIINGISP